MEVIQVVIQDILFSIIMLIVYIVVFVLFSCVFALLNCRETQKNPTYCQRQGDIYEVHKYVKYRSNEAYEVYNFRRQGNKWHYIKKKEKIEKKYYVINSIAAIAILIYLAINIGLLSGLGALFLIILSVLGLNAISRMVIVRKCKGYLRKKFE